MERRGPSWPAAAPGTGGEEEKMEGARKLRAPETADYLGLSTSTLAKMRLRGDGPPYLKAGRRIVLYDLHDLEEWLGARRRRSTSEQGLQ
jgi:predicted DNA-binding transcriptional regulator AlpA